MGKLYTDSECIVIFEILKKLREKKEKNLVMVETGCGASTIAMLVHSCIYGGKVFSWDINQVEDFLKGLFSESIEIILKKILINIGLL